MNISQIIPYRESKNILVLKSYQLSLFQLSQTSFIFVAVVLPCVIMSIPMCQVLIFMCHVSSVMSQAQSLILQT